MAAISAPLLGGFSLTLIGVVSQDPTNFRIPGIVLALFTLVTILLVGCMQIGFRARGHLYSYSDVESWFPTTQRDEQTSDDLRRQQEIDYQKWEHLHSIGRRYYNTAIIALAIGLSALLLPPDSYQGEGLSAVEYTFRYSASAVAFMAGLTEAAWWLSDNLAVRKAKKFHQTGQSFFNQNNDTGSESEKKGADG